MKPRETPRNVPQTRRYFSATLSDGSVWDLRFPSFGQATALADKFGGISKVNGISGMSGILDMTGYAIGLCWCHRTFDLESGTPPVIDGPGWQRYGDDVIDEIQEHGLSLVDVMTLLNAIMEQFGAQMVGVQEGKDLGKSSPATPGGSTSSPSTPG